MEIDTAKAVPRHYRNALLALGCVAGALFTFLYVLAPTQTLQRILGRSLSDRTSSYFLLVTLLLTVGAFACLRLVGVPAPFPRVSPRFERWLAFLPWMLIAFLVGRLILSLGTTLSYDEHEQIYHFAIGDYHIPKFNHVFARVSSYALMALFGTSRYVARIPSLITSLLLIASLVVFRNLLPRMVGLLLLLHLCANELATWFMHSIRGYLSMMLICVVSSAIVMDAVKNEEPTRKRTKLCVLFLMLILCSVTHFFSFIFHALLFLSLLIYLLLNTNLTLETSRYRRQILSLSLLFVPVVVYAAWWQLRSWSITESRFWESGPPYLQFFYALGVAHGVFAKAMVVLGLGLCLVKRMQGYSLKRDFLGIFCLVSLVGVSVFTVVVGVNDLQSRYLLPFVFPFVLWLGLAIHEMPTAHLRFLMATLAIVLVVIVPAISRPVVNDIVSDRNQEYENFLARAHEISGEKNPRCFTCVGEQARCRWWRTLYLPRYTDASESLKPCRSRFSFELGHGRALAEETQSVLSYQRNHWNLVLKKVK